MIVRVGCRRAKANPVGAPGSLHRCRLHGGGRDLRAAGRCRRGGGLGRLDLVPDRGWRRRPAGLLVRQVRGPVPLGRRVPGVRRPGMGRGPLHGRTRVVAARGQRDHHRDGRRLLRQLRQRCPVRQRRLGEAAGGADPARDGGAEHPRLAGCREGADGGGHRRRGHPRGLLGRDAEQPRHSICSRSRGIRHCETSSPAWR